MFHLFNKVYVDFDFNMEINDRIIISEEYGSTAFVENAPQEYVAPSYDEMIKNHWNGDEQAMWSFLAAIPADRQFMVYVDEKTFPIIMLKYFRAVFPNIDNHQLYVLYRLTLMKFKMIHSQISHIWETARVKYSNFEIMSESDFLTKPYSKSTSPITLPTTVTRKAVGLEMILPTYLHPTGNAKVTKEFELRAAKMIWKSVAWEINEFKRNFLNGMLDWDEIYPELGTIDPATVEFDQLASTVPDIAFLQDIDLTPHNLDVVTQYDIAKIFDVYYKIQKHVKADDDTIDGFLRAHGEFTGSTNLVHDEDDITKAHSDNIRNLVQLDIDTKFGTLLFARSEYREKMNPWLISYFYQLSRDNDLETLEKFAIL